MPYSNFKNQCLLISDKDQVIIFLCYAGPDSLLIFTINDKMGQCNMRKTRYKESNVL